jgi:S-formylglutathione hydrolase
MNGAWSEVEIAGKTADVYESSDKPRFGVLCLHGLSGRTLRDRPAFTKFFDELGLGCICPHGKQSWWADRLCPDFDPQRTAEQYLLNHVLPYFHQRWGLPARAVGLLGNSMGGQGALRLAFKHPHLFPVVAALSPAIEYHQRYGQGTPLDDMYDSKEQCRQDTAPMHIHPVIYPPHLFFCIDPTDAEWFRGCDRLHEKLAALGVPHEYDLTTRAGGHSWEYNEHMADRAVRFLAHGLEQESRRLL